MGRRKREGIFPRDRLVAVLAGAQDQWFGKAALPVEPEIGLLRQLLNRVLGEERGPNALAGGLAGNGLRTVLAELKPAPVLRGIGPRTRRAVKAVFLVDREPGLDSLYPALLPRHGLRGLENGVFPTRKALARAYLNIGFNRRLGRGFFTRQGATLLRKY